MKILFIDWASFGKEDMKEAFCREGHRLVCFPFSNRDSRHDEAVEADLSLTLHREVPDAVFSFNYFPLVSNVCKKENISYVSWIYDSPYVMLYSYTAINPCNTIYVFDKEVYLEFHRAGIQTVHYLPMAANVERLDAFSCAPTVPASSESDGTPIVPASSESDGTPIVPASSESGCTPIVPASSESGCTPIVPASSENTCTSSRYNVSFVGSLYTENHDFFGRMSSLPDYSRGYLDALMAAQVKIQGYNFIQQSLAPVMEDLYRALPMEPNADGVETKEYLYAQYVINRRITGIERTSLLKAVAQETPVDLFTHDLSFQLPNLRNHGTVDNYREMPLVFKRSRINLNISLRSILSGIPQRAFDIMGSGGFLLSNYQNDFLDYFVPDEDFVFYESEKDLLQKITYYLSHEDERVQIAANGHQKIAAGHTYRHRVREMFSEL